MVSDSTTGIDSEVEDAERAWLTPEEVKEMRRACLTETFPTYLQDRNLAIIALLYDTGLRVGEMCALDVENYDREDGVIRVPRRIQKGEAPPVPLELGRYGADATEPLERYLARRWKDTDAMFPSRSSPRMTPRAVRDVVKKAAVAADVSPRAPGGEKLPPEHVSPHTLRHSVAYRIIQEEGGRLEDVMLRLRHANRSTTDQIYSHLIPR